MKGQFEMTLREYRAKLDREYAEGLDAGFDEGFEAGLAKAGERLDKMLRERSGSPHDIGGRTLREAARRVSARVEDIDPVAPIAGEPTRAEGVTHG